MENFCLTMSVEEAAKLLGISRGLAYELAHKGQLPVIRLGVKRLIIPREALMRMLDIGAINSEPNPLPSSREVDKKERM